VGHIEVPQGCDEQWVFPLIQEVPHLDCDGRNAGQGIGWEPAALQAGPVLDVVGDVTLVDLGNVGIDMALRDSREQVNREVDVFGIYELDQRVEAVRIAEDEVMAIPEAFTGVYQGDDSLYHCSPPNAAKMPSAVSPSNPQSG